MAWQGIPFPSFLTNTLDAGLTVTKIPEIVVNTGFGWDNVTGSVIAALVGASLPTAIAWYTIKKNDDSAALDRANQVSDLRESRQTQLELAQLAFNAQVLSTNRQQWINALRDNCAEFIKVTEKHKNLRRFYVAEKKGISWRNGTEEQAAIYFERFLEAGYQMSEIATKIELMVNPSEITSRAILFCLKSIIGLFEKEKIEMFFSDGSEVKKEYEKLTSSLVKVTQRCLKNEWKRVKSGK
ncbi:TPA: hypothetical protein R6W42_000805 [Citrobacter freundii]|uniref:hypothetical protein n=1 Tax=Citrobacter freundii TaxID=546 RepID=UPI000BDDC634|nr:hypothetical protein [Citrobacter freundii]EKV0155717.1 hypothetical protein [Citrobacter freundii]MBJ9132999.1 hypothetical protein [Citrobacter freundii]PCQ44993.1 hypothetical protein CQA31_23695 [Citrobacter freundii]HEE0085844.1 hypothetical protein [Citrobacter freundii]HEJ0092644.1 hypothetical protein [Citrobacter freundii]